MKRLLFTFLLLYSFICNCQISTFPYSETFSNTVPVDFTSTTPNGWDFTNNTNPRTGLYSAKIIKSGPAKFIYIKLDVISYNTYIISFWTKNVCKLKVNVNETEDQSSLLDNTIISNNNTDCKNSNTWIESTFIYTPTYDGIMFFQIQVTNFGVGDDAFLDDILITETPPIALPITLLYLKAENIEYYNRIEWSTASETNNDYFLLEKTRDGLDFSIVCAVSGAGNSSSQRFYSANDVFITDGIVYYKLKQVDYDGKETSYDMISVDNRLKTAPKLNKITDVIGREVSATETGRVLFFHYDDGTVIKRYFSEY